MYSDSDLNKVQNTELEILQEIDRICKILNIKYFAVGGTLLGAIRHKGFIPWDDDIDIGMMRKDYDAFISGCSELLDKNNYFVQNFYSNSHVPFYHTKLMKKGTVFVEKGVERMKFEKSIFVDIMPYDYLPDLPIERKRVLKKQMFNYRLFGLKSQIRTFKYSKFKNFIFSVIRFVIWCFLLPINKNYLFKRYDNSLKNASINPSHFIGSRGYNMFVCKYDDVYPLKYVLFEDLQIPIPNNYDSLLKTQYNNYMSLPPEDKINQHTPIALKFEDVKE